ncbi:MAG: DinB family protein [Bacteroidota bacterium]
MTLKDLQTLFDYDRWATDRILEIVGTLADDHYTKNLGSSHGGIHGTLVHMIAANRIWLDRWKGKNPESLFRAEDFPTLEDLRKEWNMWNEEMQAYLGGLDDRRLQEPLSYKDLKGNSHSQVLGLQLQHLVNHSTYHRGQVVVLLRLLGVKPVSTDMINYFRLQNGS